MIKYPAAFMEYLAYYHEKRDYFECHEVLEEYWKVHPDSPYRTTWVGLIQLAVAMYHHRRGNIKGAVKMLSSAIRMLEDDDLTQLGIAAIPLKQLMSERLLKLENNSQLAFEDLNIPFSDAELMESITIRRTDDAVTDPYILNKHTLRDRTEVIQARREEWLRRNPLSH